MDLKVVLSFIQNINFRLFILLIYFILPFQKFRSSAFAYRTLVDPLIRGSSNSVPFFFGASKLAQTPLKPLSGLKWGLDVKWFFKLLEILYLLLDLLYLIVKIFLAASWYWPVNQSLGSLLCYFWPALGKTRKCWGWVFSGGVNSLFDDMDLFFLTLTRILLSFSLLTFSSKFLKPLETGSSVVEILFWTCEGFFCRGLLKLRYLFVFAKVFWLSSSFSLLLEFLNLSDLSLHFFLLSLISSFLSFSLLLFFLLFCKLSLFQHFLSFSQYLLVFSIHQLLFSNLSFLRF